MNIRMQDRESITLTARPRQNHIFYDRLGNQKVTPLRETTKDTTDYYFFAHMHYREWGEPHCNQDPAEPGYIWESQPFQKGDITDPECFMTLFKGSPVVPASYAVTVEVDLRIYYTDYAGLIYGNLAPTLRKRDAQGRWYEGASIQY